MITNVNSGSQWVTITQWGPSGLPFMNTTQPMTGQLRANYNMNQIEVFDGFNWIPITNSATVDMSSQTKEVLLWGQKKMEEEKKLAKLLEENPGLKDLHDKYEIMKALCENGESK